MPHARCTRHRPTSPPRKNVIPSAARDLLFAFRLDAASGPPLVAGPFAGPVKPARRSPLPLSSPRSPRRSVIFAASPQCAGWSFMICSGLSSRAQRGICCLLAAFPFSRIMVVADGNHQNHRRRYRRRRILRNRPRPNHVPRLHRILHRLPPSRLFHAITHSLSVRMGHHRQLVDGSFSRHLARIRRQSRLAPKTISHHSVAANWRAAGDDGSVCVSLWPYRIRLDETRSHISASMGLVPLGSGSPRPLHGRLVRAQCLLCSRLLRRNHRLRVAVPKKKTTYQDQYKR
jgi:hypothetical protein